MNAFERILIIADLTWQFICSLWEQLRDYRLEEGEAFQLTYKLEVVLDEPETECGV